MTPALIILALLAVGVAIVVWATRRKPNTPNVGPQDGDTAWNDPVAPDRPPHPTSRDPQP